MSLPPPPRAVRAHLGRDVAVLRLFSVPLAAAALAGTLAVAFVCLWAAQGHDASAKVVDGNVRRTTRSGTTYRLDYEFTLDGAPRRGSAEVSQALYERFQYAGRALDQLPVRAFALGPLEFDAPLEAGGPWARVGRYALWALLVDLLAAGFIGMAWWRPARARRLYREGTAVPGRVLAKRRTVKGRAVDRRVSYTFVSTDGAAREAEVQVWNAKDFDALREGQSVTVLYAPDDPARSTLYECGGFTLA